MRSDLYLTIALLMVCIILIRVECFTISRSVHYTTTRQQGDLIFSNERVNPYNSKATIATTSSNKIVSVLFATGGGSGSSNKKKRRRKNPTEENTVSTTSSSSTTISNNDDKVVQKDVTFDSSTTTVDKKATIVNDSDIRLLNDIAKFEFLQKTDAAMSTLSSSSTSFTSSSIDTDTSIPLPDISDVRRRKKAEEDLQRIETQKEETKVRIKRSDKEAFRRLLEQQPFADADDTLFEEEAYGTVSALLGERAKPFLSIPFGPLQVGHFIGSLVIVLMAFIQYPGFPLTNLPTPIRDALAGGLGTIYLINCLLAVAAVFKAQERGQPVPLWVIKTFAVGGLAFDQLTQLPTTEEIERAKAIKGKRALKNKKI